MLASLTKLEEVITMVSVDTLVDSGVGAVIVARGADLMSVISESHPQHTVLNIPVCVKACVLYTSTMPMQFTEAG